MRRFVAALLVALLSLAPASAQMNLLTGAGGKFKAAVSGYQGPGDIASGAAAWWSCSRAYKASYATGSNNACDLVDAATGLTTFTMKILSTGFADFAGAAASSACAVSCVISKMYDQTGNAHDLTQSTNSRRPVMTFNVVGGRGCAKFVLASSTGINNSTGITTVNQPWVFSFVGERTGNTSVTQIIFKFDAGANQITFDSTPNQMALLQTGSIFVTGVNDNSFHAVQIAFNGASTQAYVDGTSTTGTITGNTGGSLNFGSSSGGGGPVDGYLCEGGLWASDISANFSAINANQHSSANGYNF